MASTYSSLKIQLMGTGDNSGTWGNVTNVNLGTAIEEAIVGSADVSFSSGDVTLTLTDSNASQTARNLRLNLTGTSGGARNLIVPAIEKIYIVNNGLADAVTVKNSTGTGIAVPAGKTMYVYNNGTNVVDAVNHLTSLTLTTVLPVASGGTGTNTSTGSGSVVLSSSPTLSSPTFTSPVLGTPSSGTLTNCTGLPVTTGISGLGTNVATFLATPSSANLAAAVTDETGSGNLVFATSPTLVTPILGTPTSGTLTNCTGLPVTTGISGLGTNVATFLATPSSANLAAAVTGETGSGALVFGTSPTLTSPVLTTPTLGTPASGTLTNCTGLPVTTGISGLGTNVATFLATPSSSNLAAAVTGETGSGALVFGTSPTIATPAISNPTMTGGGSLAGTYSGTPTFSGNITFSSTGAITAPVGTTGQRPSAATGMLRFNSTGGSFEGYNGSSWSSLGGAQGGVGNPFVYENDITVTADYTITTGKNGMSAGPITIDTGVTVTVPDNSTWVIV